MPYEINCLDGKYYLIFMKQDGGATVIRISY